MKYLSFESEELRELINLKRGSFVVYLILFALVLVFSYFISTSIIPASIGINTLSVAVLMSISYLIFLLITNKDFFSDLINREKKVYRGVLSSKSKKAKSGKLIFNIDGNIFVIDQSTFDKYNEGDVLEIHISAKTKHLFKVEKIS